MPAEPPVVIQDAPPPSAPPAPTKEIVVNPETIDRGPKAPPPKAGSARERINQALLAKTGAAEPAKESVTPKAPQAPKAPDEPKKPESKAAPTDDPEIEDLVDPTVPKTPGLEETPKPPTDKTKEKVNPWKLVDDYKARTSKLEKELSELKTSVVPEQDRKSWSERIEKIEARNKELEDEIRYVNYEKSKEFKEQYEQPYVSAWETATAELSEIVWTDEETGERRHAKPEDLWQLVNLPLDKAREAADKYFGRFADDVMGHRKEIRGLLDKRSKALVKARENGAEREKLQHEQSQKSQIEMATKAKAAWDKANEATLADEKYGKYFTPIEGDMEGNQRLAKGYQLVDRAFNEDIFDPKLTPEQREAVIKRHAAVRHRAAAFSRLRYQNEQLESTIAQLKTELENYQKSDPNMAGSIAPSTKPAFSSAKDRIRANLEKVAVQR